MRLSVAVIAISVMCAGLASAQPALSRIEVLASHGTARFVFETNDLGAPRDSWIEYGTTPSLGYSTSHPRPAAVASSPVRTVIESGLSPSTRYYFKPVAVGASGTSNWTCTEGGLGWTCDAAAGLGMFVTSDLPAQHPAPPAATSSLNTSMPMINGQTFQVDIDAGKQCVNFQQQLAACAAADPSLNHQILIPAGASCVGIFTLPVKNGGGVCVVRTATPDSQLPPEGVRIDPSYLPRMASIVAPASATGQIADRGGVNTAACSKPVCTEGWRFTGIHFTVEDLRDAKPLTVNIAGVSDNGVITTARPHGLTTHEQLYISDVEGFDGRGPNGVFRASVLSPISLRLQYVNTPPVFTCAAAPCYKSGTGRLMRSLVTRVSAVSNTDAIVIETAAPHGLSNFPAIPVIAAANGALTVAAGHSIVAGERAVRIEGSSAPEWNGYWTVQASTGTLVTLLNGPRTSCAAECGTVMVKRPLQVAEVEGNTAANGNHYFTVLSPTSIRLDNAAGNGDYTSGGFIALDPDVQFAIVNFRQTADRMVLDRSYVNGRGFPHRTLYGVVLHSSNSAIVDSYIEQINSWRAIYPNRPYADPAYGGFFLGTSVAVEMSAGSNKKIHNNYLSAEGITLFVQESPGAMPENIEITRNRFYSDPKRMAGSPVSDTRYYPKRHHIEFKRGRRVLVNGNIIDGNWSDYTPCGPSLALSIRGPLRDNVTSDFSITNNIFRNTSSGIQIVGADSDAASVTLPTARVQVHNNLLYDIDNRAWRSNPASANQGICGYAISTIWSVEDVTITYNTAVDMRGNQPQFYNYSYGRSEGVVVRNNVFTHNHDNGAGAIQPASALNVPGVLPRFSGSPSEVWAQYFRSGSLFSKNVVVPGVRNTQMLSAVDLASSALNFTKKDCETYYAGFQDILCAGSDILDTAVDRAASVFTNPGHKDYHIRIPDRGANLEAIANAIGGVRENVAIPATSTTAVVQFFSASDDPCHLDYTEFPEGDCDRVPAGGPVGLRTVELSNLKPATNYYYRIQCPSEQLIGQFQTLP